MGRLVTRLAPLYFLLAAVVAPAAAQQAAPSPPSTGSAVDVNLPDAQTAPAPNIRLSHFEYVLPAGASASNIDFDAMLRLQQKLRAVAAATLVHSGATYGIRMQYLLTPVQPAAFRMQVAQAPPTEAPRIKLFYAGAGALKDFHAKGGSVMVVFEYAVSPQVAARRSK